VSVAGTSRAAAPPELLRITLQSFNRPLTAGEIREVLSGIVGETQWTSSWGAARTVLSSEP
jgi:hypothetical protein